jgi:hypothetical protein
MVSNYHYIKYLFNFYYLQSSVVNIVRYGYKLILPSGSFYWLKRGDLMLETVFYEFRQ